MFKKLSPEQRRGPREPLIKPQAHKEGVAGGGADDGAPQEGGGQQAGVQGALRDKNGVDHNFRQRAVAPQELEGVGGTASVGL